MMDHTVNLKPDSNLLNPKFDGYKLSLLSDKTLYEHKVDEGLNIIKSESDYYLRTRLDVLHNHLFMDPFHPLTVYYFNGRGHLVKSSYSKESRLSRGEVVWQATVYEEVKSAGKNCNLLDQKNEEKDCNSLNQNPFSPTVSFPTSDLAVVTNGRGQLHILDTLDRSVTQSWIELLDYATEIGIIVHSQVTEEKSDDGKEVKRLDCLLLSVATCKEIAKNSKFNYHDQRFRTEKTTAFQLVNWMTFKNSGATWTMHQEMCIAGEGALEYCSLDETAKSLILLCHKSYSFIFDSLNPVEKNEGDQSLVKSDSPKFAFMQSSDDVNLWLNLGVNTKKKDIEVKLFPTKLTVTVLGLTVLDGTFKTPIIVDTSTWTLDDGKLEITITKSVSGSHWDEVFNEFPGEHLSDPSYIEEIQKRLAHLTSENWEPSPDLDKPAYNPGELEDCDEASEDLLLLLLNPETHSSLLLKHLGATQHLFNAQAPCNPVPSFCLRHDVDGILWQPQGKTISHCATFHAFGYVKASKTMAKFTKAAPDNSYVAIADVSSHIYTFFQPENYGNELRNRKTGTSIPTIARQIVLSLKTHDEVLGMQAGVNALFVLTADNLYAYCLHDT